MKRIYTLSVLASIVTLATSAADFVGVWRGDLIFGANKLPIVIHINADTTATLDSPMQGAKGIPCNKPIISGDSISIAMPMLNAAFNGSMQPDGKNITGTFRQGITLPLTLTASTEEESLIIRPQTPTPPFPYITEEVTFSHSDITLAGTLSTPAWRKRHPAVVLISGSGTQDRDETIMNHRPFAVIADHLTRAGIAVLRYDDRGAGGSSPAKSTDTSFDFAKDAEAAVDYLKSRPDIDPDHIGIIGHSEGGLIAMLMAASRPDDIDFAVSLAGSAVKGKEIIIRQNFAQYELAGKTPTTAETAQIHDIFNAIDTIADTTTLSVTLRSIMTRLGTAVDTSRIEQNIAAMTSAWYTTFIRFDPTETLHAVRCPILALNGEWDWQVDADTNLKAIADAIPGATIRRYPRLNHFFQEAASKTESINYGAITQTISPQVLHDITSWILSTVK